MSRKTLGPAAAMAGGTRKLPGCARDCLRGARVALETDGMARGTCLLEAGSSRSWVYVGDGAQAQPAAPALSETAGRIHATPGTRVWEWGSEPSPPPDPVTSAGSLCPLKLGPALPQALRHTRDSGPRKPSGTVGPRPRDVAVVLPRGRGGEPGREDCEHEMKARRAGGSGEGLGCLSSEAAPSSGQGNAPLRHSRLFSKKFIQLTWEEPQESLNPRHRSSV